MTRLRSAQLLVLLLSVGCTESGTTVDSNEASEPATTRPNILLIVADDMGYTDVGSFGSEIATPNLDELAFGGIRFTGFHAASSCGPTRAMLMSGATSREAGVSGPAAVLSQDVAPLPALLRDAGYHTYMTGKWHLGHEAEQSPAARGFESSFALVRAGDNHLGASNFPDDAVAYRENGKPIDQLPEDWFSSQMYTDKLIEYIQANEGDGTPWFGYLAFTAPHWPLQVPDDWRDRYAGRYDNGYDLLREQRAARAADLGILPDGFDLERYEGIAPPWTSLDDHSRQVFTRSMELYAAMLENMDLHVGRVLEYLEASNQLENAVVLFFSDNGASGSDSTFRPTTIPRTDSDSSLPNMGREGSFVAIGRGWAEAATAPYHDVKGSLHEGGTLAAAFVSHASVARKGGLDRGYLTVMDVLPTLLEIAGTRHPGTEFQGQAVLPIRGRSFWPRVQGDERPVHDDTDIIPWMTSAARSALVRGRWKILRESVGRAPGLEPAAWKLYDLQADPGEHTDLAGEQPELASELIALWQDNRDGL